MSCPVQASKINEISTEADIQKNIEETAAALMRDFPEPSEEQLPRFEVSYQTELSEREIVVDNVVSYAYSLDDGLILLVTVPYLDGVRHLTFLRLDALIRFDAPGAPDLADYTFGLCKRVNGNDVYETVIEADQD